MISSSLTEDGVASVPAKSENTYRILIIGDSITVGACASDRPKTSYPSVL